MPAKSKKQARLFRLVKGVQSGDISPSKVSDTVKKLAKSMTKKSVGDYAKTKEKGLPTKIKEIVERILNEAEYSLKRIKTITGRNYEDVLNSEKGLPFDKEEILTFQEKEKGFGGFGETKFIINNKTKDVEAEMSSNGTNKEYAFKNLVNQSDKTKHNYACIVQISYPDKEGTKIIYFLSNPFDPNDTNEKTKLLADFIDRINSYGL